MDWSKTRASGKDKYDKTWEVSITDDPRDSQALFLLKILEVEKEPYDGSYNIPTGESREIPVLITALEDIQLGREYTIYLKLDNFQNNETSSVTNRIQLFDKKNEKTVDKIVLPNLQAGEQVQCYILVNLKNCFFESTFSFNFSIFITLKDGQKQRVDYLEI